MTTRELEAQRRLTRAFVARLPHTVRMQTVEVVTTPDGGRKRTKTTLRRSQVITLVEPGGSGYGPALLGTDGRQADIDYQLVADIDVDVRLYDEFEVDGHTFRVEKLMPFNGYEVRAYLTRL